MFNKKTRCNKCYTNYLKELDRLMIAYPRERGSREHDRIMLDVDSFREDVAKLQRQYEFRGDIFDPTV